MIKVIVSITSFGKKMNDLLPKVLFNLLTKQTFKEFRICLTLNKEDYENISNELLKLLIENNEIDLIIADTYLKPHLKYFYSMQKYKELPIITLDDDTIYPDTTIEELFNAYIKFGNNVYARKVSEIKYTNKWMSGSRKILDNEPANHSFFAEGYCGILYPPNCFNEFYNNKVELMKINELIYDDDVYLKGLEIRNGIKVKLAPHKSPNHLGQMDLGNDYENYSLHKKYNSEEKRVENLLKIENELNNIGIKKYE